MILFVKRLPEDSLQLEVISIKQKEQQTIKTGDSANPICFGEYAIKIYRKG